MNPLFLDNQTLANYGIPTNGLVALYDPYKDTYGRNILTVGSENFVTGWVANAGETITVTDYPTTINGQSVIAKRIQGAGNGTGALKYRIMLNGLTNPHSVTLSCYAMLLNGNAKIGTDGGGMGVTITPTMTKLLKTVTYAATYSSFDFYVNSATDILDIVVYQPQVNLSQLYPYSAPSGLPQSVTDYTGKGNNAQLGSAAGADTNDPAYSGQGLAFGADDYLASGASIFNNMQNLTCITVFKAPASISADSRIWDKNDGSKTFYLKANKSLAVLLKRTGSDYWNTDQTLNLSSDYITAVRWQPYATDNTPKININATTCTLTKNSTGTGTPISDSANPLIVGNRQSASLPLNSTIYLQAWYNRVLSDTEYMQAYNGLKRLMNARGVVI